MSRFRRVVHDIVAVYGVLVTSIRPRSEFFISLAAMFTYGHSVGVIANLLVKFWLLAYGRFRIRGSGLLIRLLYPLLPQLKRYPLQIPGGKTIYLDFATETTYSLLLRFKLGQLESDAGLFAEIEKHLRPGHVMWDVGAFVGYVTAHFAHPRFGLASIHAFEPNPSNLQILKSMFQGNPIVGIYPWALGKEEGSMVLHIPKGKTAMASLRPITESMQAPVRVCTGDSLVADHLVPAPDLIKIDVEGFEPEVFKGLAAIIRTKRPVIFFEHIFLTAAQIEAMVPPGYKVVYIGDDGSTAVDPSARGAGHDAMLLPSGGYE